MRLLVNQLSALRQKTGVGHYTEQLCRSFQRHCGADEIEAYPWGSARRAYKTLARLFPLFGRGTSEAAPGVRSLPGAAAQHVRRAATTLLARHFAAMCARRRYDLYHEPNFIPLPVNCPTVSTLHDLSVVRHPEWHPADRVRHFEQELPRALKECVHFVTVSEFVRQEVIGTLGVAPARVTAVHNGVRSGLRPIAGEAVARTLKSLHLPSRYLLHVGTIEPRKNVLMLLRAYCSLPSPLRERWPLLLVGGWGWGTSPVAAYWHEHARHRGVVFSGYIADRHLAALYSGARALVYPSLYEGFGLPPLEMMACGGAVLASTAAAVVETAGGQAHLISSQDVDGWQLALERVLTDDDWWQSLRRGAVEAAAPYTWDRCAAATLRVFHSVAGKRAAADVSPGAPSMYRAAS
jgi:alpha-1,3-rhamnosyl/mannosyltransferase